MAPQNPTNTVFDSKRLIGRKYSDTGVQSDLKHYPFEVKPDENDKPLIKKFTSNRVETKKKNDNINITIKRHFNPRKPPYNFNRKNIIIDIPQINNIKQFPELK